MNDLILTHNRYDFYLVSQHVTQGTVSPTHYNVIVDTLNETTATCMTPGILQKLTFKLTHMYYNWSVSTQYQLFKDEHKMKHVFL